MMDVTQKELDDYLEHFGVKGMRWGHRKEEKAPLGPGRSRKAQRKAAVKLGAGIAGIAAVTAGATFAARVLGERSRLPIASIPEQMSVSGPGFHIEGPAFAVATVLKTMGERKLGG